MLATVLYWWGTVEWIFEPLRILKGGDIMLVCGSVSLMLRAMRWWRFAGHESMSPVLG